MQSAEVTIRIVSQYMQTHSTTILIGRVVNGYWHGEGWLMAIGREERQKQS